MYFQSSLYKKRYNSTFPFLFQSLQLQQYLKDSISIISDEWLGYPGKCIRLKDSIHLLRHTEIAFLPSAIRFLKYILERKVVRYGTKGKLVTVFFEKKSIQRYREVRQQLKHEITQSSPKLGLHNLSWLYQLCELFWTNYYQLFLSHIGIRASYQRCRRWLADKQHWYKVSNSYVSSRSAICSTAAIELIDKVDNFLLLCNFCRLKFWNL